MLTAEILLQKLLKIQASGKDLSKITVTADTIKGYIAFESEIELEPTENDLILIQFQN